MRGLRGRSWTGVALWATAASLIVPIARPGVSSALPPGFTDTRLASLGYPVGLGFTPDGRILVTTQAGLVRVYQGGSLLPVPALDITDRLCTNRERGLVGIGVDPNFASNQFIYLYYTRNLYNNDCPFIPPETPVNRLSRFVLPSTNVIDPASESVLMDFIPSPGGYHNAGDIQFGADGLLYLSVGDGNCQSDPPYGCGFTVNNNARKLTNLNGKILRVSKDGSIPLANPYAKLPGSRRCGNPAGVPAGTGPCKEIFAHGLRNPFRMSFRPGTNTFHINDVGAAQWEEIDLGARGADYGWNVREGHCAVDSSTVCGPQPVGMTNPIFDYNHNTGCGAITGSAFVPSGVWPAPYDGSYLYADFNCQQIFRLVPKPGGTGYTSAHFTDAWVISMAFGPSGSGTSLYYTSFNNGGELRRIAYTGTSNLLPSAQLSASPMSGSAPLTVEFNGAGSADPDGTIAAYIWNFGDGAATESGGPAISHTYANGTYFASLTVRDDDGGLSDPVTVRIDAGNFTPTPVIDSPPGSKLFRVGETITLVGHATDPEDGILPDSKLTWSVFLRHEDHYHPFLSPTSGNNIQFPAPAPEGLDATQTSSLLIMLTASDSATANTTIEQVLQPHLVTVHFATQPAGLNIQLEGATIVTPVSRVSWEGYGILVNAPKQMKGVQGYGFKAWSDGGAQQHTIVTPAGDAGYTAYFKKVYIPV